MTKENKIILLVVFVGVFFLGIFFGYCIKKTKNCEDPINVNFSPTSCQYYGKIYKSGDSFPADDGCNTCGCEDGKVMCTLIACE